MEMVMSNGFAVLNANEMMDVNGGSQEAKVLVLLIGGAVVSGILAPVTCGGSLAVYAEGALAGYSMMAMGVYEACK